MELTRKLHEAVFEFGTLVNEERPEANANASSEALYRVLDEQQQAIAAAFQEIAATRDQRDRFDQPTYRRGRLLVLSTCVVAVALIATLVWIL